MADITPEAAAKRPFDEHRHAVLMLRIFVWRTGADQLLRASRKPSDARNA
jgi:hypothetical protein